MLKNYFKTALRIFKKNKVTAIINVLGLSVGISASIVIFLMVQYDYSFDKWEPQAKNVFAVTAQGSWGEFYGVPLPAAEAIKKRITGIESMCYYMNFPEYDFIVTVFSNKNKEDKIFNNEKDIVFADENYFKIFPHQWLKGNPAASLSQPNQVVLSLSVAKKYFPNESLDKIIGQRILFGDSTNTIVSGIIEDLKQHTDFDNKSFISYSTFTSASRWNGNGIMQNWNFPDARFHCFLRLFPNTKVANVKAQLKKIYSANVTLSDPNFKYIGSLQPLKETHFGINWKGKSVLGKADKSVLFNLGLLAFALLLLAVINFINLSTAQSTLRAKEIGLRKTLGSSKKQIIHQFLTETFLSTVCATIFAIALTPFLLYVFKGFVPEGLDEKELLQPIIIIFLVAIIIIVTLLAGLYPAFVLTKFRPALVLKNNVTSNGKSRSAWVRGTLTVFQFVIAQVFLIAVIVVGKQIHYEVNKDIGIRKDAIVSFKMPYAGLNDDKVAVMMNELKKIPEIQNVSSYGEGEPYNEGAIQTSFTISNKGRTENKLIAEKAGDSNYIKVFNIPLLAGRNIRVDTNSTQPEVLINEAMMKEMGFQNPYKAIGNFISRGDGNSKVLIVGVMKDFNMQSLHFPVKPLVFESNIFSGDEKISIALNPSNPSSWQTALQKTEKVFKQLYPNKDFDYTFYDKEIENIYKSDIRLSTLLKWATGLAIFISCLGLLGLVSFMANQRIKEIGIRKVLGASVMQIIILLSKNLGKLILIASVIAIPIAWYFSNNWLQDFAFKISLSWWIFLISGICMLIIALVILCLQTIKAATANPVKSLRTE
ncbi:MAG TPA: ABC transporter permease [Parafilimonas sp.]|nr:ABC transporter permease [Parafilimonas sp.]